MMRQIRMAGWTALLGGVCAVGLGVTVAHVAEHGLTFASWGGTTQEAQMAAWAVPFTEATGMAVAEGGPTDYGKIKAMVEAGNVEWDVVDVEGDFAYRGKAEGLIEPLDYSVIDTTGIDERYIFSHGIADFFTAFVLAYNTNVVGDNPPTGWAAFFDTETYPEKRAVIGWPSGIIEMALLADGVAAEDLYPLDLDRAFAKLDTVKDHIVFWFSGADQQQLLASGEAVMCFCWDGRVSFLMQEGAPVDVVWDADVPNVVTADYLVVPKGSPNKDAAMQFINVAVSPEGQAKLAELTGLSPINEGARDHLDPEVYDRLSVSQLIAGVDVDLQYWVDNGSEVYARWNEWKVE